MTSDEATMFWGRKSRGSTTPEKRRVLASPFMAMLRSPATTRWPLGSTLMTEAAIWPVKLLELLELPSPLKESLPEAWASRFRMEPRKPVPELLPGPLLAMAFWRLASVLALLVALMDSAISIFSESPTLRGRARPLNGLVKVLLLKRLPVLTRSMLA